MEGELIFVGFMMLIGQIILMQMWNSNWFKRENFKMQKKNVMDENRIKMRKLEKDMGLTHKKTAEEPTGGLLDQLKNLDMDKIKMLLSYVGKGESDEGEGGLVGMLEELVTSNPQIVEQFLKGLGQNKGEQGLPDHMKGVIYEE